MAERVRAPRSDDVVVIAHRACWTHTVENSLAAVKACLALGVDGVEFDVRHSKDGVAVILHDETVDRMTEGHGRVDQLSWAELQQLHLRRGNGGPAAPLTDERIPTLQAYLKATEGRLLLVFDVKDGSQKSSFQAADALGLSQNAIFFYECQSGLLKASEADFADRVTQFPIMFSADKAGLAAEMAACPSHPAGMAHVKWRDADYPAQNQTVWHASRRTWIATMFPEDVAGLDDAQALKDPDGVWGRFIRAGANMIMTNAPDALEAYLRANPAVRIPR